MIIALSVLMTIVIFLLLGTLGNIGKIQKQLEDIDREQHQQNKEIIELLKHKSQTTEMLIQHVDILQYLVDQDPVLGSIKKPYRGPMGEA
jgi:hypothetical protein